MATILLCTYRADRFDGVRAKIILCDSERCSACRTNRMAYPEES